MAELSDTISRACGDRIVDYAATHGPAAAVALSLPWGVTPAAISKFCRDNEVRIRRHALRIRGRLP